jgi:hypothetical protein
MLAGVNITLKQEERGVIFYLYYPLCDLIIHRATHKYKGDHVQRSPTQSETVNHFVLNISSHFDKIDFTLMEAF